MAALPNDTIIKRQQDHLTVTTLRTREIVDLYEFIKNVLTGEMFKKSVINSTSQKLPSRATKTSSWLPFTVPSSQHCSLNQKGQL